VAEIERAHRVYAERASRRAEMDRQGEPDAAVIAANAAAARGQKGAEELVATANEALKEWRNEFVQTNLAEQGALVGARGAEEELKQLLRDQFEVFAEDAEELTQQAHEALMAFEEAYRAASQKWRSAAEIWSPLATAVGVAPSAAFPLPDPDRLFPALRSGALAARPPAVEAKR